MESIPSSDATEKEKRGSSAAIFLARNTAMVQRISGPLREEETAKVVKALKHPSLPPTPMEAAKVCFRAYTAFCLIILSIARLRGGVSHMWTA